MPGVEVRFRASILPPIRLHDEPSSLPTVAGGGGLFIEYCSPDSSPELPFRFRGKTAPSARISWRSADGDGFLSMSFSVKGSQVFMRNPAGLLGKEEISRSEEAALEGKEDGGLVVLEEGESRNKNKNRHSRVRGPGAGAMNTTKHLWAGAVAAMVSRYWEHISYSLFK